MDIFTFIFIAFGLIALFFLIKSGVAVARLIKHVKRERVIKVYPLSAALMGVRLTLAVVFMVIGVNGIYLAADTLRFIREVDEYGREEYAPIFAEEYEAGSGIAVTEPLTFLNSRIEAYSAQVPDDFSRGCAFILLSLASVLQCHIYLWIITENGLLNRDKEGSHTPLFMRRENGKLKLYYTVVGKDVVIRQLPDNAENTALFGRFLVKEPSADTAEIKKEETTGNAYI